MAKAGLLCSLLRFKLARHNLGDMWKSNHLAQCCRKGDPETGPQLKVRNANFGGAGGLWNAFPSLALQGCPVAPGVPG